MKAFGREELFFTTRILVLGDLNDHWALIFSIMFEQDMHHLDIPYYI